VDNFILNYLKMRFARKYWLINLWLYLKRQDTGKIYNKMAKIIKCCKIIGIRIQETVDKMYKA